MMNDAELNLNPAVLLANALSAFALNLVRAAPILLCSTRGFPPCAMSTGGRFALQDVCATLRSNFCMPQVLGRGISSRGQPHGHVLKLCLLL